MEKIKFEDYVMMIRKMAHKFSNKHGVPYDELESQGFLIYCECVKTFDLSKGATFGTHLFTNLKRLNDYAITYKRQKGVLIEDITNSDYKKSSLIKMKSKEVTKKPTYDIQLNYDNVKLVDLLEYAQDYLSNEAYKLFKWILERSWDDFVHTKPSIKMAMEKFNMTRTKMSVLWNECFNFWNNVGVNFYY